MKIDLSDLKPGDKCFSIKNGNSFVKEILSHCEYPLLVSGYRSMDYFDNCGKYHLADEHPALFYSAQECADYFKWVAENEK